MVIRNFLQQIAILTLIAGLSFSCSSSKNTKKAAQVAEGNTTQNSAPHIIYGDLIINDKSDYLMIPVDVNTGNQEGNTLFSSSRYPDSDGTIKPYNIIFYAKKDGSTHLLLDKKAIINDFKLLEYKSLDNKTVKRIWLYKIIEQDTNDNKKLDYQDAHIGYISDISGKNLAQITPSNTQMMKWDIVPSVGAMFIKIAQDTDSDRRFTDKDKTAFIKVDLENPGVGKEIISNQLEQEIESHILK
jgi:hypothetical protein